VQPLEQASKATRTVPYTVVENMFILYGMMPNGSKKVIIGGYDLDLILVKLARPGRHVLNTGKCTHARLRS
jgi:hypothetical protein